ncbi:UDP-N-acetylmuramate dehydrogenase [Zafaria sp. J156]|uniref:UDP-N-acetylmuramate dehydrogenase n=1 Tax=Zafaria sp. J156 TaxID=3116490 RepID=UPI002E762EA1|nr:UDP-N-acetylmuramate dehydrogenase [Zafaria sp. J156]MEE1620611.1 UDP-N-acetylmuramate dehydrogenase [Zafaria sp. J156]
MTQTLLSELTTNAVGGPADRLVEASTREEITAVVQEADASGTPLLIVGGGSNLVVDDAGFAGTVLRITSRGITVDDDSAACAGAVVTVEAGHPWDEVVQHTLSRGLTGLEALSGIPGSTGATPVQNVGAYGADVSQTISRVTTWDREAGRVKSFAAADLGFGYRDSLLKRTTVNGSPRYVVLAVSFQLTLGELGAPLAYAELARALGRAPGERAPAVDVRREVLRLRAGKGMVLDPADRDTFSSGSFFTNPVVDAAAAGTLPDDAPRYPAGGDGLVKLSAAWLIDRAGFPKGFGLPGTPGEDLAGGRASLSTKHTLAVTNRGGAGASDLLAVARAVRDGVSERFGIELHSESLLINCAL